MVTDLDDLFGRTGNLLLSTADTVGGLWGILSSGFVQNAATLDGDKVRFDAFEPHFFRNAAAQSGNQSQITLYFTPYTDDWQAAVHLRVQSDGFTCYQLLFGPGAGVLSKRTSASQTWHGTQLGSTATNVSLPAGHRSLVTLVLTVSSSGVLSASVNGTPLDFGGAGGTFTDTSPLGVGGYGLGGRAHDATRILGEGSTGGGDLISPTLTSPTGTATGPTTATGTVSTNEANGTLYFVTTTNASETDTTVKAGSSQAVTATGLQNVSRSGLTASTTYRHHYLHQDSAGNDSAVVSSATFTTPASGDATNPTLTGSITVSALTSTSYTLTWPAGSDNVAITGYEVSLNGGTSYAAVGNVLTTNITGRTPGSTDAVRVRAFDGAGNRSTPALSASVTLNPAPGTLTLTTPLVNNTGGISGRWVSTTGIRLSVISKATGLSVLAVTGRATDSLGVLTAPVTDAAITTGQQYGILSTMPDGSWDLSGPLTAT